MRLVYLAKPNAAQPNTRLDRSELLAALSIAAIRQALVVC